MGGREKSYVSLYVNHVMGADRGADLDFCAEIPGSEVTTIRINRKYGSVPQINLNIAI